MRLTLVGTGLRLPRSPIDAEGAFDCVSHNLAVPLLRTYVLAQPDLAERWEVETVIVPFAVDQERFEEGLVARVLATAPDVLGLSCYWWDTAAQLALAERVRRARPETRIVVGGPAVTNLGERLLHEHAAVDVAVRGEGELRLAELLRRDWSDLGGLAGVSWRAPDGSVRTEPGPARVLDFDEIPSPYLAGDAALPEGAGPVFEFSRGCPFRCKFCDWKLNGARLRQAPLERVRAEMTWARTSGQSTAFIFDSALNNFPAHLERVTRAAAEADPGREVSYSYFLNTARLDRAQVTQLSSMRARAIEIGLNSVNSAALGLAGRRPFDREAFAAKLDLAAELGPLVLHLIIGLPGDDLAGIRATLDYAAQQVERVGRGRVAALRVFWMVIPPGSQYWDERAELGLRVRSHGIPYALETRELSQADLVRAVVAVQEHRIGDLCIVDGPPELLRRAQRHPFRWVYGSLAPYEARPVVEPAAKPTGPEVSGEPPVAAAPPPPPAPPEEPERRMSETETMALLAPLRVGRPLGRAGWRVSGLAWQKGWPVVELSGPDGLGPFRLQVARRDAFARAYARTVAYAVRWLPERGRKLTADTRAFLEAFVRLIRRNERGGAEP